MPTVVRWWSVGVRVYVELRVELRGPTVRGGFDDPAVSHPAREPVFHHIGGAVGKSSNFEEATMVTARVRGETWHTFATKSPEKVRMKLRRRLQRMARSEDLKERALAER